MEVQTICIIDDDEIYQFTTSHVIRKIDANKCVLKFSNGLNAIEFFNANLNEPDKLPELILLDINMPIMDGWEFIEVFVKLIPQLSKKVMIYMISSSVDEADIKRSQSIAEITSFITKPVAIETLMAAIKTY